jgi:tetratricopeptide (TPR) repeat protein
MRGGPGGASKAASFFVLPFLVFQAAAVLAQADAFDLGPDPPTASSAAQRALETGRGRLSRGDEAGAEAIWKASLRGREDGGLLDALGSLYFRQTRLDRADSCFERLVRLSPESAVAWYRLGLVRAACGRYRRASDAQRLAVGLAPDFGPAYCALALDLREGGQRDMGGWAVRRAISLMPRYAGAWNLLGALQQDAGRTEDARRSFITALQLEPVYPGAWFNLAQLWERLDRRDLALRCYGNAVLAKPDFIEARLARAGLMMDSGPMDHAAFEAARKDYSPCLGIEAWAPEAWWGLRRVDAAEGRMAAAAHDLRAYRASVRRRDRTQARMEARGMQDPSPYEPELPVDPDAMGSLLEARR